MAGSSVLITAIVVQVRNTSLSNTERATIDEALLTVSNSTKNQSDLFLRLEAMAGTVYATTIVSIVFGVVFFIIRLYYLEEKYPNFFLLVKDCF